MCVFFFLPPQVKGVCERYRTKTPIMAALETPQRGAGLSRKAAVRARGPGKGFGSVPPLLHRVLVIIIPLSTRRRWHSRRREAQPSVSRKKPRGRWGALGTSRVRRWSQPEGAWWARRGPKNEVGDVAIIIVLLFISKLCVLSNGTLFSLLFTGYYFLFRKAYFFFHCGVM